MWEYTTKGIIERIFACHNCGKRLDRDVISAFNMCAVSRIEQLTMESTGVRDKALQDERLTRSRKARRNKRQKGTRRRRAG